MTTEAQPAANVTVDDLDELHEDDDAALLIGDSLLLHDYHIDGDRVRLEVEAVDRPVTVSIIDGGALMSGGQVRPTEHRALPDRRTEIVVEATTVDGTAFLSVEAGGAIQGIPIESSEPLIGGPWSSSDAQAVGFGTALSVSMLIGIVVARRVRGRDQEPERVA